MKLTAAVLRKFAEKGMTLEDVIDLAETWEEGEAQAVPALSKGAMRTRKWRERLEATGLSGEEWRALSAKIIARDGGRCRYCDTAKGRMCCDHVTPLVAGGDNSDTNLVAACEACNGGKSGRSLEEWKGAAWAAKWRSGARGAVTSAVTSDVTSDVSHVGECAQVVTPSSSLRSEGTQEANASFVDASKPADPEKPKTKPPKATRGTRLPEDWEPSEADVEVARSEGLNDEEIRRAATEFRNYWCARSRDATRLDWPRTWHNRVLEIGDRKRRNGPRLVASPGQPGGHGRGAVSFADIYARRHGYTAD